ncbi:MAG: tRNA (N6-threonylcarbamoyladenosine(37)-N6)-methyltransferase TrmO [Verrucomicrobiales bacterium]|nr:tRNA (N6-threonylcarbamoyladenosine(37)-N6)-methyltransferase TrmO [Verrucomicrobiales bacterium]
MAGDGRSADADVPRPSFNLVPIGKVERQGETAVCIRLFDEYADGLLGLVEWSHVNVFYWFDKNDTTERRRILRVHPRGNRENPLTGVFACRAPVRPNLIALSVCRILSVEGSVVTVDALDAFDQTPVLDLKPFIPPDNPVKNLKVPAWAGPGR